MKRLKVLLVAILALLTLIVVLQNTGPVETRILFVTLELPVALLLFVTGAIGFVLGMTVSLFLGKGSRHPAPEPRAPPP